MDSYVDMIDMALKYLNGFLGKKMQPKGIQNNYLVGDKKLVGRIYPSEQISEKLEPLFDKLFDSLKNTDLLKKFELFWR